ncbi:MAG: hypothetical protein EZS28_000214 [Streblomastix strix]|uniref:Uncharacterized protein n=1 Tax=Streblomastix strix TaxID=222440 RepID=A0A5J4XBR4_9EUKA|nr:MAG: hypothetical protein EZS28_000214 [Streblomastix strix]
MDICNGLKIAGPVRNGLDMDDLEINFLLCARKILGKVVISMVLVSVVPSKIVIRSWFVLTISAAESIVSVKSQLLSIGRLACLISPNFFVPISVSMHAMDEFRVTKSRQSPDQI